MEERCNERGYCVQVFAHGISSSTCASCSDTSCGIRAGGGKKNMKWDVNFTLLSLLFINSSLCPFSADVSVTRSVTVSNELHSLLHSPQHFIYGHPPPPPFSFTPIWSFTVRTGFTTSYSSRCFHTNHAGFLLDKKLFALRAKTSDGEGATQSDGRRWSASSPSVELSGVYLCLANQKICSWRSSYVWWDQTETLQLNIKSMHFFIFNAVLQVFNRHRGGGVLVVQTRLKSTIWLSPQHTNHVSNPRRPAAAASTWNHRF